MEDVSMISNVLKISEIATKLKLLFLNETKIATFYLNPAYQLLRFLERRLTI